MRRRIFDVVRLEKSSGVICLEMMKKFQDAGFRVAEVPVHHYHRAFGKSQFFNFRAHLPHRHRRDEAVVGAGRQARAPGGAAGARRGAARRPGIMSHPEFYAGRRVMITGGLGLHRQQPRARAGRAGRGRAARRLADPRLRRQPAQHRRHRGSGARQRRRRAPGLDDELPRAGSRGHLQPGRPGEPHRQHAGSAHRSRDQLPQPADAARGLPAPQPGRQGRLRQHAPDLRQARCAAGDRAPSRTADRRQRHQQGRRRVLSPRLQQRLRRARRPRSASRTSTAPDSCSSTTARASSAGSSGSPSRTRRSRSSATARRFATSSTWTMPSTRSCGRARPIR